MENTMHEEFKKNKIDLIPDENGFLFEIVDYNYLLNKFCEWFVILSIFLFLLIVLFDGDILALRNEGYRGYLLVTVGGSYILFEAFRMFIYCVKDKREKLKFYSNYIYRTNDNSKIYLENIKEGYIAKYNTFGNKIPPRLNNFIYYVLVLGTLLVFIIIPLLLLGRFVYSLFKGKKYTVETDNLILIQKIPVRYCIAISLKIASEEDKEKINQYLYQYIHTDINKIEKILYKIPQLQKENL